MSTSTALGSDVLTVFPGSEVSSELRVRNRGTVVDEFTFEVLGAAATWTVVEPAALPLFPGEEGGVQVRFQPPRTADIVAGRVPFGVKVISREDSEGSVVEEGVVEVGAFSDAFAELTPRTSRGRRAASHDLAFDNRGNAPVNATVAATDPDQQLDFAVDPPALVADPGTATFAKVKVSPRKRFLRGPPVTHPFQVIVQPDGQVPVPVDGSMLQEPLLPQWLPRALAALLALLLALLLLWLTLLKPAVKSAAKDAVEEEVQPQLEKTNAEQAKNAAATQELAQKLAAPTQPLAPGPAASPAPVAAPSGAATLGEPFDTRLEATPANQAPSFQVPADRVFSLTDIVLQNPQSDQGLVRILRGPTTLLVVRLQNFRDLDYHFVAPVIFRAGERLTLQVSCEDPNPSPPNNCTPAAYFSGHMR